MAHLSKSHTHKTTIGAKIWSGIRTTAEVAGAAKTAYDIGKGIYSVGRIVGPMLAPLL